MATFHKSVVSEIAKPVELITTVRDGYDVAHPAEIHHAAIAVGFAL